MNTVPKPMYEWKNIPWEKVFREVFKLQKRIYRASLRGDKTHIVIAKIEVPDKAKLLRSRMTGNCHVRI